MLQTQHLGVFLEIGDSERPLHLLDQLCKQRVRKLPFHTTRRTYTSRAIAAGRSVRWVAGQLVGIREVDDQIWLVSFLDYDLGFFDRDEGRVEPAPNPFGPEKVSTMSPESSVNHVPGMDLGFPGAPERTRTSDPRFRKPMLYPTELRGRRVED